MLLAAVFEARAKAHDGIEALGLLCSDGAVTVYAHALLAGDHRRLSIGEPFHDGLVAAAPAAAALVGALVSLQGGPMTAAMLTLEAGLVSAVRDLVEAGLDPSFFEELAARLRPGRFGLVAEIELEELCPLEACMASHGGQVIYQFGHGLKLEDILHRKLQAWQRHHVLPCTGPAQRMAAPPAGSAGQARAADLHRSMEYARQRARALRREAAAKAAILWAQAALAKGPARQGIEARACRVRTEIEERAARLDRLAEEFGCLLPPGRGRGAD